jgi:glycosyltransferase involved in cell wall biosynthesis
MNVRILHVATRHRVGGAERNLLYTIRRQLGRGFDVHVAVGTEELEADFPPQARIHPLPKLVRDVSPPDDWRAMRYLRALIRAYRFDVVHTHQSKAGVVGRAAACGLAPTIVHTVHMASFGPMYGPIPSAVFLTLERRLARITDRFVFVGAELLRRYVAARVARPDRSMIVHSPITNLESLVGLRDSSGDQKARARAAIGIPAEGHVVLMVGALDRRKRHALAIRTLAPLLREGKTEVLIAGQGPERGAIEILCRELGVADSVRLLGFVRDVTTLYASADVFVHTSTLEGVPQTVVQAIAAGVPVIATEVDGVREATPGLPHVTILPADGRWLLETVRARIDARDFDPAPPEFVKGWLPNTVDAGLGELHDWMEYRVGRRRADADLSPDGPIPPPSTFPTKELAIR